MVDKSSLGDGEGSTSPKALLGPVEIRDLANRLGVRPTKKLGQNFVHDAATVRMIVREAGVNAGDAVLEVGPGLGSLTLGLLETGAYLSAVEIDPVLAGALETTVATHQGAHRDNFALLRSDALKISSAADFAVPSAWGESEYQPRFLVANLPYNVSVPILLNLLEVIPSIERATVMVQSEVADRLAAEPGSRTYGVPSVKAAWYGRVWRGSKVSRQVFWPIPNVDSALVHFERVPRESGTEGVSRERVFAVIDAAFSQRRKTLRAALASWAGSAADAESVLRAAGVDPSLRGEKLQLADFVAIAKAAKGMLGGAE